MVVFVAGVALVVGIAAFVALSFWWGVGVALLASPLAGAGVAALCVGLVRRRRRVSREANAVVRPEPPER